MMGADVQNWKQLIKTEMYKFYIVTDSIFRDVIHIMTGFSLGL